MEKLKILIKLSYKFTKKYTPQYVNLLAKPLIAVVMGIFFMIFIGVNPLISLLSIPCFCYAFWRGFFTTYALNYAAYDFRKENTGLSLCDFYKKLKDKESNFALYITFCAFLTLIFYIPTFKYSINAILGSNILSDPYSIIAVMHEIKNIILINTLFLLPFLNYMTQAYFFKKENENFIQLFLNCYKKLDLTGLLVCIIISVIGFLLNYTGIIILLFFVFNPFCYAINTFWYSTRVKKG